MQQPSTFKVDKQRSSGLINHLKYLVLDLFSSFRIRAFRLHIIIYIFSFTAMDVFGSVFTYYVVYCLSDAAAVSGWLSIAAFASVPHIWIYAVAEQAECLPFCRFAPLLRRIFFVLVFLFTVYLTKTQCPRCCSRRSLSWAPPARASITYRGISTASFLILTRW